MSSTLEKCGIKYTRPQQEIDYHLGIRYMSEEFGLSERGRLLLQFMNVKRDLHKILKEND